jgi:inhibitor of cysteine peptidase
MKRDIYNIIIILLMAAFLAACVNGGTSLGEQDNGKVIEVKKGQILDISLPGNPTTGYNWVVDPATLTIITQEGEPDFKADSDLIGAGGMITLNFKATALGQETLHLEYRHPWEAEMTPEGEFDVTVVVK